MIINKDEKVFTISHWSNRESLKKQEETVSAECHLHHSISSGREKNEFVTSPSPRRLDGVV